MPRLQPTLNGLDPYVCVSAVQKCIRRGLERQAMEFVVEMSRTSEHYFSWVCNRIEICAHEDIGLADREAVLFASQAIEQARRFYKPDRQGECLIMVGNAVRVLCRAEKSREGDHYQAVCMLNSELNSHVPDVPDFAYDRHNVEGRKRGRGVQHFRDEGTQLSPVPAEPDPYEEEAYELWFQQEREKQKQRLF